MVEVGPGRQSRAVGGRFFLHSAAIDGRTFAEPVEVGLGRQSLPVGGGLPESVPELFPEFLDVPTILADILLDHIQPAVHQVESLGDAAVQRLRRSVRLRSVHCCVLPASRRSVGRLRGGSNGGGRHHHRLLLWLDHGTVLHLQQTETALISSRLNAGMWKSPVDPGRLPDAPALFGRARSGRSVQTDGRPRMAAKVP